MRRVFCLLVLVSWGFSIGCSSGGGDPNAKAPEMKAPTGASGKATRGGMMQAPPTSGPPLQGK